MDEKRFFVSNFWVGSLVNYIWDNLFRRSSNKSDVGQVLKSNYIFQDLSPREIHFVKELVHVRTFKPGETMFRQGEVGIGMYIIMSGLVEIFVEDMTSQNDDNPSLLVTRLQEGDFMGELSLVEPHDRRSATARAGLETVLLAFFKPDLLELIERNPSIASKILLRLSQVLSRRLKETATKITELKRELKRLNQGD